MINVCKSTKDDLHDYSFYVVLDIPTKDKTHLVDTKKDVLDLRKKNITCILPRTVALLHTKTLNISYNKLSFFPSIHSLRILNCSNCRLRSLPAMSNLVELNCANNLLTSLPIYKKLVALNCSYNFIKRLRVTEYLKLKTVNCSSNLITDLPMTKLPVNAAQCPILTIYHTPTAYRRSGVIKNGKFTWVVDTQQTKYALINWQTATTKLLPTTKFAKRLFKFLFYS